MNGEVFQIDAIVVETRVGVLNEARQCEMRESCTRQVQVFFLKIVVNSGKFKLKDIFRSARKRDKLQNVVVLSTMVHFFYIYFYHRYPVLIIFHFYFSFVF